jgi:hypothetical protein
MLLFFFMVSTTMREVTYMVQMRLPQATELSKLEKKSLVSYIYVGEPLAAIPENIWRCSPDPVERSVCKCERYTGLYHC